MKLMTPPPEIAHSGLRALKTIAIADGHFHPLEQQMIASIQAHLLKTDFDIDSLGPITPQGLAASVSDPDFRERILSPSPRGGSASV